MECGIYGIWCRVGVWFPYIPASHSGLDAHELAEVSGAVESVLQQLAQNVYGKWVRVMCMV